MSPDSTTAPLKIGNAPCSWGTIEGMNESERLSYKTMLDELVAAGYTGTELGDYGFMPTDARALREALTSRTLTMLGAYVDVALAHPEAQDEGLGRVLSVAELLQAVADVGDTDWQPYLVLADKHSQNPARFQNAGRVTPELSLDDSRMQTFAEHANRIAEAVGEKTGLRTVFHHHCAGFVETPEEIERFLELTDPNLVSLVFDTGHYLYGSGLYGSGANEAETVVRALERFWTRISYVHFKDVEAGIATRARREGWDYKTAIGGGVFCELGKGCIDFGKVIETLNTLGYRGWVTVEQDMLPGLGAPKESATRNRDFLRSLGV